MFPSILIVDDELSILQSLSGLLSDEGFQVATAGNGYEALKVLDSESPDLVLLDIWMPGIDGIETLKEIRKQHPHIHVIIITGHGNIETAVKATKLGAFDLIEKPLSIDKVIVAINNALNFRRLEEENRYLRKKMIEKNSINGSSPKTVALKQKIAVAAPTDKWILITGEHGTGKELVARSIHQLSLRADQPMFDVNCAAIPDNLIESELFGHEKGAFAGADNKKIGKFELANNGTLFLDEIGDMSLVSQAKILRVLQEQRIQRMGSNRSIPINVRVIAASNKDLEKEIALGNFREDLYYRLSVIPIHVPPLRERAEDIPLLVEAFIDENVLQKNIKRKHMPAATRQALSQYPWPGNVRELKNLVERLLIMVPKDVVDVEDLPSAFSSKAQSVCAGIEARLFAVDNLKTAKAAFEKEFIQRKLLENDNNIAKTADAIGIGCSNLYKRLKKYRIDLLEPTDV
jgi:two-component system nitrogen regulation response regulator NtrX